MKTGKRGHTRVSNRLASRAIQVPLGAVAEPPKGKAGRASGVAKTSKEGERETGPPRRLNLVGMSVAGEKFHVGYRGRKGR